MMHAPLTNEVAQRWAEELISSAFASVGTAGDLQPPFCMEGVSGSSDGSGPAGASLLEVPAGDGGPASPERFGPAGPRENDWRELLLGASSLGQMGAIFCWGLARGFVFNGMELFSRIAKPFATCVASYPPGLFPLPCDFDVFREWAWPPGNFTSSICVDCWVVLVAAALNSLYGLKPPYPRHRGSVSVKKCLGVIRDRVTRFLGQELNLRPSWIEVWKDLKDKKLNYNGEEVALAQPLTFEQLLPSLPPEGHGGSVELAPLLEGRTRFLMENPDQVLLKGFDCFPGKNNAKVHVSETEAPKIFRLLFERGVIDFVSSDQVHSDRKGPFLSGMFGVAKPNKFTPGGKQALRLIMNLIPINRALEVILGDISELPTASTWQQLVLTEGDSISISQADMASAFYLFRVPPAWLKYLCFNFKLKGKDVGFPGSKEVYPACRVLPMGWASSVGIMQMASRELIRRSKLPEVDELCKQGSIPRWFVDWSRDIPSSSTWWQVYLDNFMAAEVCRAGPPTGSDVQLHTLAVGAWDQTGVLCSKDKDVLGAEVATELGVQIHGPLGLLGGSMDRLFRNVLATLVLVSQNRASPKLVQIVLGRWIFVLQYRRPAMAALSRSWDYISDPRSRWKSWSRVCEELTLLFGLVPLLQFDLRLEFSNLVSCADASESGGAVAISRSLSESGKELEARIQRPRADPLKCPILVVSAFNGIGGAFRAYDLAGILPSAIIAIEIDPAARRVVRGCWPHCLEVNDVMLVDLDMVRQWANLFPRILEVHIWGGFPCVHLSSARSDRLNLAGEGSNLFFKLVEIIELCEHVFGPEIPVEFVVENVFSMDVSARTEISMRLDIKPLKLDPADCTPMSRPRLAWVSKAMLLTEGVEFWDCGDYTQVVMEAEFPPTSDWVGEGWEPTTPGITYPTFMKAIARMRPPPNPAGLRRCDEATYGRWRSDSFRFPPYQYSYDYLLRKDGRLRYLSVSERELLMGMGHQITAFCQAASTIKSHPLAYWDKRFSLLGDGFSMLSFGWIAGQLCRQWLDPITPQQLIDRFGLAPGATLQKSFRCPLQRRLGYGELGRTGDNTALVAHVSRHVAHNGSDVSISLGVPYSPKGGNHVSLRADWWTWKMLFVSKWKFHNHINSLEMRMIVQTAKWRSRNPDNFCKRWLHLADSMVCNYILSKGRTSSHMLQPLVKQHAAILLAMNSVEIHGHVDSSENPTDKASRA